MNPSGPGTGTGSGAGGSGTDIAQGPCSPESAQRACHRKLGEHDGLVNCYVGVQYCEGGVWGDCVDGKAAEHQKKPPMQLKEIPADATIEEVMADDSPHVLTLTSVSCNDPCDPSCWQLTDTSPMGGMPVATPGSQWYVAANNPAQANAGGLGGKGLNQPCGASWDCEFGMYCKDPITDPSCNHDKCAVGQALDPNSCNDDCVQAVCNSAGNCCTSCAHSPCATGSPLSCPDLCVFATNLFNFGCLANWGPSCVSAYEACRAITLQGFTCPSNPTLAWDSSCVDAVHDVCGVSCVNNEPSCAHDRCATGGPLNAGCDTCVSTICGTPSTAYCCSTKWDAGCTAAVNNQCGLVCPLPSQKGQCILWTPNQVDSKCASSDLVISVPCQENAMMGNQQVIPVCNVGTQPTPANTTITINVYHANSSQIPSYPPGSNPYQTCSVSSATPVLQGKCIDVPCNTTKNDEIFINPPGPNQVPECNYRNNWSINLDSSNTTHQNCDHPICNPPNGVVWSRPTHMFMELDRSSNFPTVAFSTMQTGIYNWLTNAGSLTKGTYVGYGWFPQGSCDSTVCTSSGTCATGDAQDPFWSGGGSAPAKSILQLNGSYNYLLTPPVNPGNGGKQTIAATAIGPYSRALQDAITMANADYAAAVAANPGRAWMAPFEEVVLVIGTDPSTNQACAWNTGALAGIAAAGFAAPTTTTSTSVRTHVIALGNALQPTAQAIANAGGGLWFSHGPVTGTNATAIAAAIKTDLDAIRGAAYPCSVALPPPDTFNVLTPRVRVTLNGMNTLVTQVSGLSQCAPDGFYYDDNNNPTQIILCPNTCKSLDVPTNVPGTPSAVTSYVLDCPSYYTSGVPAGTTYTGNCPVEGTAVQWRYFAYDSIEPPGTSLRMSVQTPTMSSAKDVAWPGHVAMDPAKCWSGGPMGCPIDLVSTLDGSAANGPAFSPTMTLNLTAYTNPNGSSTATLNKWQLMYSCPDVQ